MLLKKQQQMQQIETTTPVETTVELSVELPVETIVETPAETTVNANPVKTIVSASCIREMFKDVCADKKISGNVAKWLCQYVDTKLKDLFAAYEFVDENGKLK